MACIGVKVNGKWNSILWAFYIIQMLLQFTQINETSQNPCLGAYNALNPFFTTTQKKTPDKDK